RGRTTRLQDHGGLHGRDVAGDGARRVARAIRGLRRSRRTAAAHARPGTWPAIFGKRSFAAACVVMGLTPQFVPELCTSYWLTNPFQLPESVLGSVKIRGRQKQLG